MMITKIKIENIKGFGIPGKEIKLNLDPSKINLCIAPNGFGKSSLAVAFESLNQNRLDVGEENKNINHKNAGSSIVITIDGQEYTANDTRNEINSQLRLCVIHNRTRVDYTKKHFNKVLSVNAFMAVEPIVICSVVPPLNSSYYSINVARSSFGTNKKILKSIEFLLNDTDFCVRLSTIFDDLQKFTAKKRYACIQDILDSINDLKGNESQIIAGVSDDVFSQLESIPEFVHFTEVFRDFLVGMSKVQVFNVFFQLLCLWKNNNTRDGLRKACESSEYAFYKSRIDSNLKLLDTTGRNIRTDEKEGKLIVHFPHADKISNGQRDVLTFAIELMIFKSFVRPDKKYLLIVDEVFDYLDDANTMAAQYYLSNLLKTSTGNIYFMLLTHLNPFTFRNYVFNPKVINEVYLEEVVPVATSEMMSFISFRQWLDPQKHPERKTTFDNLSCDIFHYNPNALDRSAEIASYNRVGVKSTWGNPVLFRQVLIDEMNKYLSYKEDYDPYAVAIAMRLRMEKIFYDSLPTQELRNGFVATHKTNDKLEFCERNNLPIPEAYFIVNSIHNEADHLKQNPITGQFEEKSMVYKLQNKVIHNVVEKLFDYKGVNIDISYIS